MLQACAGMCLLCLTMFLRIMPDYHNSVDVWRERVVSLKGNSSSTHVYTRIHVYTLRMSVSSNGAAVHMLFCLRIHARTDYCFSSQPIT
jgi:hypothetical protein